MHVLVRYILFILAGMIQILFLGFFSVGARGVLEGWFGRKSSGAISIVAHVMHLMIEKLVL